MGSVQQTNVRRNGKGAFLREFIRHPLQVGSVIPSSSHMERHLAATTQAAQASLIVELGAGNGGVTKALLQALPENGRLLTLEINPELHKLVQEINDERLLPHMGSAADLQYILNKYSLPAPDVVVSGIPFSTMNHADGSRIVEEIRDALPAGGSFVAYQAHKRVAQLVQECPGLELEEDKREWLNIPPMMVYRWRKMGQAQ